MLICMPTQPPTPPPERGVGYKLLWKKVNEQKPFKKFVNFSGIFFLTSADDTCTSFDLRGNWFPKPWMLALDIGPGFGAAIGRHALGAIWSCTGSLRVGGGLCEGIKQKINTNNIKWNANRNIDRIIPNSRCLKVRPRARPPKWWTSENKRKPYEVNNRHTGR